MAYTKYSLTPSSNTAAPPDGAPEGMLPSAVNDTMRDMMAQIRDVGDGIRDGTYTMTAAKITGGTITGSTINNSAIGGTTAAAGKFTTLEATGATTFSGATVVSASLTANTFSSSGATITGGTINSTAIGGSTAAAGKFTTLEATGVATFSAGAVGTPAITTTGDTNTGIFFPAADTFAASTDGSERMRIDSAGTLFIGATSSPSGTQRLVLTANGSAGTEPMLFNELRSTAATENYVRFYRNGSQVGSITNTLSATAYVTSSDYRLKDNVAPMTGALAKVAQLKPVTYNWKVDGSDGQGFIAHELQAVVPDCVTGEKDAVKTVNELDKDGNVIGTKEVPEYQGIDTSFLVATLTAAIQEQQAQIEELKAEFQALKGVS